MGNHEAEESLQTIGNTPAKAHFRLSPAPITGGEPVLSDPPPPEEEDLGSLPEAYGQPVLYLVARDPEWFYAYWELPALEEELPGLTLRVVTAEGDVVCSAEITREARNWYLAIPEGTAETLAAGNVGRCVFAELGYQLPGSGWRSLIRSGQTTIPPRGIAQRSESTESDFATVPFHLAFQKLIEMVQPAAASHPDASSEEPLLTMLARLQGEGRQFAAVLGLVPQREGWNDEQRRLLAALLGHSPGELLQRSTEEVDALLSEGLRAHLASRDGLGGSFTEALRHSGFSSFGDLSSYSAHRGSSSEALSSWLSSWGEALGGNSSGALFSWASGRGQSSSEAAYWQQQLSSWESAPGGSSGLSSSAGSSGSHSGSSWSGGFSSFSSAPPRRDFFLHVNAEVILYGGTHPEASVTIDGDPVRLNADGTFRHHFRFPDGIGSVPITAVSPDGVEQRGVLLRFDRDTHRSAPYGSVEHTPQPGELADPLWRRKSRKKEATAC